MIIKSAEWPFLKMAMMFVSLQADGRAPSSNDCRKNEPKIAASTKVDSLRTPTGILIRSKAFSGLMDSI